MRGVKQCENVSLSHDRSVHFVTNWTLKLWMVGFRIFLVFWSETLLQMGQLDYLEPLYLWKVQILLNLKEIHHALCKSTEWKWFWELMQILDKSSGILPLFEMVIGKRLKCHTDWVSIIIMCYLWNLLKINTTMLLLWILFVIPQQIRRDVVLASSVRPFRPSTLFVRPKPYLSTYWSDLMHSWYKWSVP